MDNHYSGKQLFDRIIPPSHRFSLGRHKVTLRDMQNAICSGLPEGLARDLYTGLVENGEFDIPEFLTAAIGPYSTGELSDLVNYARSHGFCFTEEQEVISHLRRCLRLNTLKDIKSFSEEESKSLQETASFLSSAQNSLIILENQYSIPSGAAIKLILAYRSLNKNPHMLPCADFRSLNNAGSISLIDILNKMPYSSKTAEDEDFVNAFRWAYLNLSKELSAKQRSSIVNRCATDEAKFEQVLDKLSEERRIEDEEIRNQTIVTKGGVVMPWSPAKLDENRRIVPNPNFDSAYEPTFEEEEGCETHQFINQSLKKTIQFIDEVFDARCKIRKEDNF